MREGECYIAHLSIESPSLWGLEKLLVHSVGRNSHCLQLVGIPACERVRQLPMYIPGILLPSIEVNMHTFKQKGNV